MKKALVIAAMLLVPAVLAVPAVAQSNCGLQTDLVDDYCSMMRNSPITQGMQYGGATYQCLEFPEMSVCDFVESPEELVPKAYELGLQP